MRSYNAIIKAPVITEKSTQKAAEGNTVVFWVEPTANKHEIKDAVEKAFSVTVVVVNTLKVAGKIKRMGKYAGRRPTRKKAYVTLKEGDKIEIFAGV